MKVLLINVSLRPESPVHIPPIGLGYVATAISLSERHELDLLDVDRYRYTDEQLRVELRSREYDVVALGCIVTGYSTVKKICNMIKDISDVPIIVGNTVVSTIPDWIIEDELPVDIVFMSEGEYIVDLLDEMEQIGHSSYFLEKLWREHNGRISYPLITNIDELPFIDWGLFDIEFYLENSWVRANEPLPLPKEDVRLLPVNSARGCAYDKCTFCRHFFSGQKYRTRDPDYIAAEIVQAKREWGINYIEFSDELTFYSRAQTERFVDALAGLDVYWTAACRANLFRGDRDLDLAKKMKDCGCIGLGYSLESADEGILKAMNKKLKPEQFVKQSHILQKAGLATWTSLVIGYPQETPGTIKKTFDTCIEARVYPSTGYLLPQPGTPIYDFARSNGTIQNSEEYLLALGDRQDLRVNLTMMTDEQLENEVQANLLRVSRELGVGLSEEDELIKTTSYRVAK